MQSHDATGHQNPPFLVEKRQELQRELVNIPALARQTWGSPIEVKVIDLSRTGFRLFSMTSISLHHSLFIKLPCLELLEARVRWAEHDEYGCEFCHPLYPAVFDYVVDQTGSLH